MLIYPLLTAWLSLSCVISGEVIWHGARATGNLTTHCPITAVVEDGLIRLASKRWVVEIPIPKEGGVQAFIYRWGQSEAQVGNHTVSVAYGPAGSI